MYNDFGNVGLYPNPSQATISRYNNAQQRFRYPPGGVAAWRDKLRNANQRRESREYNQGQRAATYEPPTEARRASSGSESRRYNEGQRDDSNTLSIREAFLARDPELPPLSWSAIRDAMLRELLTQSDLYRQTRGR
jgi:hypothetical protein